MTPKWIIEDYDHDSSVQPLIDEILKQDMELSVVEDDVFNQNNLKQYPDDDCVIFYGTLNMGRRIQQTKKWIPGAYCNFQNLCCHTYYSYWAKYLLNQDYMMLPMLEILRRREEIFFKYGIGGSIFIRPDSGAKPITGQTIQYKELDKEFELFRDYAGKELDQIVAIVSSPKPIDIEWRCVVADKKVIAFSQYKKDGELSIQREIDCDAFCLADKIAKEEWQPDRVYVLDICRTGVSYFLLEANSFSCSGLYESNPSPIVKEVSRIAMEEWKEYNE